MQNDDKASWNSDLSLNSGKTNINLEKHTFRNFDYRTTNIKREKFAVIIVLAMFLN